MLNIDKIFFYILILIISGSCGTNEKNENYSSFQEKSAATISLKDYNLVFNMAKDTLQNWIKNDLPTTKAYKISNWALDSLICFNKSADKCVLCVYRQYNAQVNNALDYFYGAKVNDRWYFFTGPVVYLFSEKYGQAPRTALTFKKMHEIALKEIFGGYLDSKGEINEEYFKGEFEGTGWCDCKTQAEYEKVYLEKVNNNWYWAKKDTIQGRPPLN